jgi:hypothetical protein
MTNVPTLGDLLAIVFILTFIPFWTAFLISYVFYRRLRIGLLGGLTGVVSFFVTLSLLDAALWIRGIIGGVLGGSVLVIILSRFYKPQVPNFKLDKRTIVSILLTAGLISSLSLYYLSQEDDLEFSIDDPSGDVSYSGYTEPKLSGHDNIDILRLESRVVRDSVVLEMELAGKVEENSTAKYTFFIATQKPGLWGDSIIEAEDMEKEGNVLRAHIPVDSLKDRKIFHVMAIASDRDVSNNDGKNPYAGNDLYDNCAKMGWFWGILDILS